MSKRSKWTPTLPKGANRSHWRRRIGTMEVLTMKEVMDYCRQELRIANQQKKGKP